MIVDCDGRILAQADPGPGEKIVVSAVDIASLQAERDRRSGHQLLAHRRVEAYPLSSGRDAASGYPAGRAAAGALTVAGNERATAEAKAKLVTFRPPTPPLR